MIPIKDISEKMVKSLDHAKKKNVEEFLSLHEELEFHLHMAMNLLTRSIETIEKISTMKFVIMRNNLMVAFSFILFFIAGIFGVSHIENSSAQSLVTIFISVLAGIFLWQKVKHGFIQFNSFKNITDHENNLISSMSRYIEIGKLLKPYSMVANELLAEMIDEGLYTPKKKEVDKDTEL